MSLILNIVQVVQLLSALGMIGLILVQHGKGADMGAALAVAARAACLVPAAVRTFCHAPPACWPRCFLSAPWPWRTSVTCVLQAQAAC